MDNGAGRYRVLLCTECIPKYMTARKLQNTASKYGSLDEVPGFKALKKINPDTYADLLALMSGNAKNSKGKEPAVVMQARMQPIDVD